MNRFEDELATLGVDCERVEATSAGAVIEDIVAAPAVGVDLPFAPDALAGTMVETDPTPGQIESASTGVTPARFAIAAYGTVAVPSTAAGEEPVSLFPSTHVAVVPGSELYADLDDGFDRLEAAFAEGTDGIVFATGPSATADMGGLVRGAHGPRTVHVVVVTDR